MPCPSRLIAYVQSKTEADNISEHPRRLMVVSDGHPMPRSPLVTSLHSAPLAPPWPPLAPTSSTVSLVGVFDGGMAVTIPRMSSIRE